MTKDIDFGAHKSPNKLAFVKCYISDCYISNGDIIRISIFFGAFKFYHQVEDANLLSLSFHAILAMDDLMLGPCCGGILGPLQAGGCYRA